MRSAGSGCGRVGAGVDADGLELSGTGGGGDMWDRGPAGLPSLGGM